AEESGIGRPSTSSTGIFPSGCLRLYSAGAPNGTIGSCSYERPFSASAIRVLRTNGERPLPISLRAMGSSSISVRSSNGKRLTLPGRRSRAGPRLRLQGDAEVLDVRREIPAQLGRREAPLLGGVMVRAELALRLLAEIRHDAVGVLAAELAS